jgi:hypothetical protein
MTTLGEFLGIRRNPLPAGRCKIAVSLLMAGLVTRPGFAQSGSTSLDGKLEPTQISRVEVGRQKGVPAVEITSTRQVIPTVIRLDGPQPRLIIDLPNAQLAAPRKRIGIHYGDVDAIRVAQYPMNPPVVQIIVELVKPHSYTWEAAGNRLIVRLQDEQSATQKEKKEEKAAEVSPIAEAKAVETAVPASLVKSPHMISLDTLASGAVVSGDADTAVLRMSQGEVYVCPGTAASVTRAPGRPETMLAISTGSLETHYTLGDSSDSILTPDFRILLRGPGEFHYAIKVDARGNACIRSLPHNTGSVKVSELMGSGEREVRAGDQLVFHSGRFAEVESAPVESCGCAVRAVPVIRAALPVESPADSAPLPPLLPRDVHVQVDVPLVFSERSRREDKTTAVEEPAIHLITGSASRAAPSFDAVSLTSSPPAQAKPSGFLGKIKGFMAGMFR